MLPTYITFPIERGGRFWVKKHEGMWSGWRDETPFADAKLVEVAILDFAGHECHIYFCYIDDDGSRVEKSDRFDSPHVARYDCWALRYLDMEPAEKNFLAMLFASDHLLPPEEGQTREPLHLGNRELLAA